jgi:serine/threonine protein kinase
MQFQYNSDYPDRFYNSSTSTSSHNHSSHTQPQHSSSNTTTANTNLHNLDARDPYHFPPVQPISCTRITTRIYNPITQTISTVPNVLVKTQTVSNQQQQQPHRRRSSKPPPQQHRLSVQSFDLNQFQMQVQDLDDDDDEHMYSSDSDFSSDDGSFHEAIAQEESGGADHHHYDNDAHHIAYWIQNIIREAIYGRVYKAIVLRKIHPQQKQQILLAAAAATVPLNPSSTMTVQQQQQQQQVQNNMNMLQNVEWEITNYDCAVKEMSWQHIRKERDRLAEDPVKEVCAMQYFKNWYNTNTNIAMNHAAIHPTPVTTTNPPTTTINYTATIPRQPHPTTSNVTTGDNSNTNDGASRSNNNTAITTSFQQMLDTNVMMPLDLLSDEKYLYSIMPYCNGGELFELLNMNDRFTENEARYWMYQVLNGIESLQHAGICHRDMSLENLLVHNSGALIIDMGMCLRIPFQCHSSSSHNVTTAGTSANHISAPQQQNLSSSFKNMQIVNTGSTGMGPTVSEFNVNDEIIIDPNNPPEVPSVRNLRRYMMKPQGICGKWHYMSPEVHNNNAPFDGYTVDMWAAGVILFLMLTGFPPWDRPSVTDERFKYMSAGYLVQMLTEWEIGLSSDAMDLLQRMMFLDPKDRLSLDQVRAHPWMVNGPCQPPIN